MRNMAFAVVGNVHVLVLQKDPTPNDWELYLELLRTEVARGRTGDLLRTLVFSDGGGPSSVQRTALREFVVAATPPPVAIVTDSGVMRGIITALQWFNTGVRAYAPAHVGEALTYLGVPANGYANIRRVALELLPTIGLSRLRALDGAALAPVDQLRGR